VGLVGEAPGGAIAERRRADRRRGPPADHREEGGQPGRMGPPEATRQRSRAMRQEERVMGLVDEVLAGRLSRRAVMRRSAALGLSAPVVASLLAVAPRAAGAQGGTVKVASNASDPAPRQFMEENTVPNFEAAAGVEVELTTVNHEDFKVQIRTYLASDDPPDVLTWFAGNRMRFFADRGLLLPLDDLYQAQGWATAFPEGILATAKGNDGKYYFVPENYYGWSIHYRKSIFQEAGIEAVPQTFDELLAAVEQLRAIDVIPITIGSRQPWTWAGWFDYLNMRTHGPEFHVQLTDGQIAYNSPEVKETFANWRRLLDAGAFIDQPETLLWQEAVTPMYQGEAAMYLIGSFLFDEYPDDGEEDVDFFAFPKINEVPRGEDGPTDGFFAAAKAPSPELAKQFLAYVGGAAHQQQGAEVLDRIAVNTQVPGDIYSPRIQKSLEILQTADYIAQFYDRDTPEEMAALGMAAFQEFVNAPDDIDAILDGLDEERQRIFEAQS
jgi:ABC-type glycerol-3-phosphate transport system substrate-binding protein